MKIPKDKWLHFGVALVISLFHPLIAVVLSVLKELFDFIRYGYRSRHTRGTSISAGVAGHSPTSGISA